MRRIRNSSLVCLLCLALAAQAPASAAPLTFTGSLSGAQEVPPVATPATGDITVVADDVTETFAVSLSFQDLLGLTRAAHLHLAPAGQNGTVALVLGIPVGVTSGSLNELYDPADFVGLLAGASFFDIVGEMQAGRIYVNVHSEQFAAGEIRAQLTAVPAPGAAAVMLVGLAGLGLARRLCLAGTGVPRSGAAQRPNA